MDRIAQPEMHFACQSIPHGKLGISRAIGKAIGVVVAAVKRSSVDNPAPDRLLAARKSAVEGALCWETNSNTHLDPPNHQPYADDSPP
jgi:hypothetical protein